MDRKYRVVVVGMGKRGMHHAPAFPGQRPLRGGGRLRHRPGARRCGRRQARGDVEGNRRPPGGRLCAARCLLLLHHAERAHGDDPGGHRERRPADRHGKARSAHQRRRLRGAGPAAGQRREGGGQPPTSLRRALPEGTGNHRQRCAGPCPYRVWDGHRLDDAHALPPDRLHALVQRRSRRRVGDGAGAGRGKLATPILLPTTSAGLSISPTACGASSNAGREHRTSRRWTTGGGSAASERRARTVSPRC